MGARIRDDSGPEDTAVAQFVKVADVREVAPGEMAVVELDGHLICLANVAGRFCAVEDDCTHVGGPLDEGELDGEVLTCPWHLAQFNILTGRVLRGPARTDLPTYEVHVEGDDVLLARPA
jgi:3-phenylpropionate/trans-cinnamate dioxygenase ferredoxin component